MNPYAGTMDKAESARVADINGWWEVKDNPISTVGVFPYSGKVISPDLPPDKFFMVFRPPEELGSPECVNSFKLLPWTNDHPRTLLGDPELGGTAPEEKGIEGVIGEQVYFNPTDETLYANIKVFSGLHAERIASGKTPLSSGYRCNYEYAPGVWKGIKYDYVQRQIRGNHMSSVNDGRLGPSIAVMDGLDDLSFTVDAKEFQIMKPKKVGVKPNKISTLLKTLLSFGMDAEEAAKEDPKSEGAGDIPKLLELLKSIGPLLEQLAALPIVASAPEMQDDDDDSGAAAVTDPNAAAGTDGAPAAGEEGNKEPKGAMDAKEVARMINVAVAAALKGLPAPVAAMDAKEMLVELNKRNVLAEKLSHFVGTFDASEMTHQDVAAYGIEKLKVPCTKGHEITAIEGFLFGRVAPTEEQVSSGMDGKESTGSNWLKAQLDPSAKTAA